MTDTKRKRPAQGASPLKRARKTPPVFGSTSTYHPSSKTQESARKVGKKKDPAGNPEFVSGLMESRRQARKKTPVPPLPDYSRGAGSQPAKKNKQIDETMRAILADPDVLDRLAMIYSNRPTVKKTDDKKKTTKKR